MEPAELAALARAALDRAHAPYSGYRVGAALLCADGTVFAGCNVENASYGLSNCAERTALFAAVASGRTAFAAIAVAASGEEPPYPCGACRQVLAEFCGPEMPVHVETSRGVETTSLGALLPCRFGCGGGHG